MTHRVSVRPVALFLLISFGGAWLVASPLWFSGQGLVTPGAPLLMVAMMFVPALAALIAHRTSRPSEGFLAATTLRPERRFGAWFRYALLAWLAPIVLTVLALLVSALLGAYTFDLVEFSGATEFLNSLTGGQDLGVPVGALVAIQVVSMFFAPLINVIPAMGEELGWRGYLQRQLMPLGQWASVVLTGVAWGLWHAPVILLGYNYPGQNPVLALGMMVVFCVLMSVLLGWITIASGTVWTAAIAHGFVNGVASIGVLLAAAGPTNSAVVGLLGASGWIVMAVVIAGLVIARRFPVTARTSAAVDAAA